MRFHTWTSFRDEYLVFGPGADATHVQVIEACLPGSGPTTWTCALPVTPGTFVGYVRDPASIAGAAPSGSFAIADIVNLAGTSP